MRWREISLVFAALNLLVCLPIHVWLARLSQRVREARDDAATPYGRQLMPAPRRERGRSPVFLLMLAGFAVEASCSRPILVHMVPLTGGARARQRPACSSPRLFGPSQVASRLINMLFGGGLPQTSLAVIADRRCWRPGWPCWCSPRPRSPARSLRHPVRPGLRPSSIVGGTLPLELFGRDGYGARVGWITAARQFSVGLRAVRSDLS